MRSDAGAMRTVRRASALVVAGALLSGPAAVLLVSRLAPQPDWVAVPTMAAHYHPLQLMPYLFGFALLFGFVRFVGACHALAEPEQRARSTAALIFTGVYAAFVFLNYTLQVGYVPRLLAGGSPLLATLTMNNPMSLAWFLEMFGYAALGVATWLVAPLFHGNGRAAVTRWLLVANGVCSIAGAALTALVDRFVFTPAGLVAFGVWNVLVIACFGLIALGAPAPTEAVPEPALAGTSPSS